MHVNRDEEKRSRDTKRSYLLNLRENGQHVTLWSHCFIYYCCVAVSFVDGYCKGTLIERVPDPPHKKRGVTSWLLKALCSAAEPSQHKAVQVASSLSLKDVLEHITLLLLTKHLRVRQPDSVPSAVPTGLVTFSEPALQQKPSKCHRLLI